MVLQRRRHEYDENDNRVVTILAIIHLDPHISARRVERAIGIPRNTFLRIMKEINITRIILLWLKSYSFSISNSSLCFANGLYK